MSYLPAQGVFAVLCPPLTWWPLAIMASIAVTFNVVSFLTCSLFHVHCSLLIVPCSLFHVHCCVFILPRSFFHVHSSMFILITILISNRRRCTLNKPISTQALPVDTEAWLFPFTHWLLTRRLGYCLQSLLLVLYSIPHSKNLDGVVSSTSDSLLVKVLLIVLSTRISSMNQ